MSTNRGTGPANMVDMEPTFFNKWIYPVLYWGIIAAAMLAFALAVTVGRVSMS